jgi:intein/homing endonuclease
LFHNGYNITLKEKSSEKLDEEDNSMDMIYTSPPYYCLTPDTKLYTTTGLKQIKDIQIGDLVYTHTGKWRKVTKLINHDINENIMLLKFYGCSEPLKITKNHKIWILKAKRCSYCNCICVPECGYLRSQSKEWKFKKCYHEYKNYKPEFLPVGKITDSDYICFPRDKRIKDVLSIKISDFVDKNLIKKEIVDDKLFFSANQFGKRVLNNTIYLTNDFWKLAGYFIAEGCTTNRSEINFTFNENEIEYLQEVTKLFESVFGIGLRERKGVSVIHLVTYNRVLQSFFSTFFGKYAHGKKLPNFFFHLPYEKQSNFLKGYINGDGCCINTKNERRYSMVTVSPVLAGQLRYLFHRLGVANKISYNDKTVGLPSTSKLGIIKKHGSYSISIAGQSSHILDDIYGIPYRKQQKKSRDFSSWITDEFIGYLVIKKGIQEIPYSGKVYNLEVEIDNSYTLLQGNVHNCVEDYGNEPEQLAKGRTYEEFLLALKSCISEGYRVLKPEKYCIFNINDFRMDGIFYPYHADVAKLFQEVGFKLWDIIIINWRTAIGASFASQIEDRKICAKMHEYLVVGRK